MGPAFAFDYDARWAMQKLIENGYAHGLLAGNALATHDLEGALLHTALGQDIYTQKSHPNGHYNHLDVINKVRASGSIPQFINDYKIDNGIMYSAVKNHVPFVLTGSIRDDGPLPEVIGDAYQGQSEMRKLVKKCTTIICLATMLHTIAAGNMTRRSGCSRMEPFGPCIYIAWTQTSLWSISCSTGGAWLRRRSSRTYRTSSRFWQEALVFCKKRNFYKKYPGNLT